MTDSTDAGAAVDHVGVATEDAAELAGVFEDLLGTPSVHEETFDGMQVVFLEAANGAYFEILEPLADGPIRRFLDSEGPGMHHVAVRVADVDAALDRARDLGVEPIDEEARPGAWGHTVAFLHPRDTGGVLVEFVEASHGAAT